ncbi:unnamed protein product [Auanema sp. JU1783]|nr:unnamed protein product [Auanema sp. JU1783]
MPTEVPSTMFPKVEFIFSAKDLQMVCFRLIEASKGSINCLECAKPLTSDLLCQDKRVFLRHFQPNDEYTEESESQSQTLTESEGEQDAEMSMATSRRPVKRAADSSPDEYDEGEAASELSQMNVDDTTQRRSSRRSSKQFSMSDKPDKSKLRRTERSSDKTVVATDSNGEDSDGAD